ncbi:hypothetical protein T09_2207 [Trichinella sp. T9]|nr:hypothetical protein T09_2207 [Trichinella sp. T9]
MQTNREHCLEYIRRKFYINIDGMELYSVLSRVQVSLSFVLLRLTSYQHRTFLAITRHIRIHEIMAHLKIC